MPLEPQTPSRQAPASASSLEELAEARPSHCLNCGVAVTGNFCGECGQANRVHRVSLRPLLADLMVEVISWDSRLLRTLRPLLIRPGFLTNEYNTGRFVPYLSPLKLYLTVSVLFFLLMAWKNPLKNAVVIRTNGVSVGSTAAPAPARVVAASRANGFFEREMAPRLLKAQQSKSGFITALLNDIPKMMFLLLPCFAVWLKLLYLRTRRLYVEHVVFLLHVHAFGCLILSPLLLFHPDWLVVSVVLLLNVYLLTALHVVYRQSWIKTLVKFALVSFGYILLFSLCFVGTTLVALWLL